MVRLDEHGRQRFLAQYEDTLFRGMPVDEHTPLEFVSAVQALVSGSVVRRKANLSHAKRDGARKSQTARAEPNFALVRIQHGEAVCTRAYRAVLARLRGPSLDSAAN